MGNRQAGRGKGAQKPTAFPLLSRPSTYVVLLSAMLRVSSALEVDEGHSKLLVELGYWGVFGGFVVRH